MMPSVGQLEAFLAFSRYGSLTRAAAELGISQPAVSKALMALEARLKVDLFHRSGHRLLLTDRAKALIPQARGAVEGIRAFRDGARAPGEDLSGSLVIACTASIADTLLLPALNILSSEHPRLSHKVIVANYRLTMELLMDHEVDIGLVASECKAPGVAATFWREDRLTVFSSPDHPAAKRPEPDPMVLQNEDWIIREPGSGSRRLFEEVMSAAGLRPKIRHEYGSNALVRKAVLAGMGIGLLSDLTIADDLEGGRAVRLDPPGLSFRRPFNIVLPPGRFLSPAVRKIKETLLSVEGRGPSAQPTSSRPPDGGA